MTTAHGIERDEWERRYIAAVFMLGGICMSEAVAAAELEAWPAEVDDWAYITPEAAADETLSYWDDDGE